MEADVAALFVTNDSIYKRLPNVDAWDKTRDARHYGGSMPVVAHPPCRAWASLRHCAKPEPGEKDLARLAIAYVDLYGGVLEHPQRSTLWREVDPDKVITVDQHWFGHRAQKRTKLYIPHLEFKYLPPYPLQLGQATHTVGLWSGRDKATCRPSISKREFEASPPAFAKWLVDIARCHAS